MVLNFYEELLRSLRDPKEAAAYLEAAFLENDAENWLIALGTLAQAKGGLTLLSKKTGIHRVHLYRMLGKDGNPSFKNVVSVLDALGVKISFNIPKSAVRKRPKKKLAKV